MTSLSSPASTPTKPRATQRRRASFETAAGSRMRPLRILFAVTAALAAVALGEVTSDSIATRDRAPEIHQNAVAWDCSLGLSILSNCVREWDAAGGATSGVSLAGACRPAFSRLNSACEWSGARDMLDGLLNVTGWKYGDRDSPFATQQDVFNAITRAYRAMEVISSKCTISGYVISTTKGD